MAYQLALLPKVSQVHDMFHVSMLRKYQLDPNHVLDFKTIDVDERVKYVEEPLGILAQREQFLRNKIVPLVKFLWRHHDTKEATWESEEIMRQR